MSKRYGLPYMGSKNKIAEWVLQYIPKADNFYDLFCGGYAKDYIWIEKKDISPKPVQQCDLNGTIIQIFGGAREASRVTGYNSSGIIECCNGKMKQYKGYIWKYKK